MTIAASAPTRVLVTGGAGFIGSHLCETLLAEGISVRVIDDLSMGRRENLPEDVEFIEGDILDPSALGRALDDVDAVAHLAARVSVRQSVESMVDDARVNVLGTVRVLEEAGRRHVLRLVLASSMAVYDEQPARVPLDETHPAFPRSPYGAGKLAAETYLRLWSRAPGRTGVALRLFNTYGPRQTPTPYVGVITIFLRRLLAGEPCTIFGDGAQTRDFIHVRDVAEAFVKALVFEGPAATWNIGTGCETDVNELERLLRSRFAGAPAPAYGPARAEELCYSVADSRRARQALGWSPARNLDESLDDVIAWLRGRENGAGGT